MLFSEREIEIAKQLHELNMQWQPQPGQYVFDMKGIIEKPSPFQKRVYFILDIKHFLKRGGSVAGIKAAMCWLPLWEDCRNILKSLEIPWNQIESRFTESSAFQNNRERLLLYEIVLEHLK